MKRILTETAIAALIASDPEAGRQARYARLSSPAARRLDGYKKAAADSIATILRCHPDKPYRATMVAEYADWRNSMRHVPTLGQSGGTWQSDQRPPAWRGNERQYYVDSFDNLDWRQIGRADEVIKREGGRGDVIGYYVDDMQNETVSGHVLQIPARGGKPQYVPAIAWTDREGVTVYPLDRYDSPMEAARAADGYAERTGEEEREYNEAWQAGARFAELAGEIAESRRSALALLAEMRAERKAGAMQRPAICAALRSRVETLLEDIRNARAKRSELEPSGWWDARLTNAWNDGAAG